MVVLVLPRAQLADELLAGLEGHPSVELLLVGAMTALDFPIGLRPAGRVVLVGDAELMQMPGEVGAPFGAVVRLNPPDRGGERLAEFVDEVNGGLDGVVVVDLENAVARGFIDGGELVEATRPCLEMLDVHLDRLPWDVQLGPPPRTWSVPLLGDARDVVLAQDPPNGRRGQRDGMIPPKEGPQPRDPVLAFLPDTQHQRFDVRRCPKRTNPGPGQPGLQALEPLALVPSAPFVEEGARNPEEPTGTADGTAELLKVLEDAQGGRRPLGPLPVANHSVHPGPPFASPPLEGAGSVRASP